MNELETMTISIFCFTVLMIYMINSSETEIEKKRSKHLRSLKIGSTILATDEFFLLQEGVIKRFVPFEVKQVSHGFLSTGKVYQPEGFVVSIYGQDYFFRPEQLKLKIMEAKSV